MNPMTQRLQALLDAGKGNRCCATRWAKPPGRRTARRCAGAPAARHHTGSALFRAWKLLGKAQLALGDPAAARQAWEHGLACAQDKGDAQVVKELGVFLKRLDKQQG
jgi:hypothetical protein